MKKIYLLFIVFIAVSFVTNALPFTPGNIVVVRVGTNGSPTALSSAAAPVFLDEYTPGGGLVQSIPLPTTVSGANLRLTNSGSATSEGSINLSQDRAYLTVVGYDADVATAAVVSTTSAATKRVVGVINTNGDINTSTGLGDAYSANNIRGAYTTNGFDIWTAGTATSGGGVRYTNLSSSTSVQLATTPTNVRTVSVYNGQLYVGSSTTGFYGISSVGTNAPTTSGQTVSILPGFPTVSGPSTYGFEIKPFQGDVAYVADDRSVASGGGIQKWVLSAGTWTLAYTLSPGGTVGARSVTVDWRTATPVIYAISTDSKLISITDAGAGSPAVSLITAGTNTALRGVAFAPGTIILPVSLLSFDAKKINNTNELAWKVTNETDLAYYEVERSSNGQQYNSIGRINTSANNNYSFTDAQPFATTYYRLKMTDKNGKFSYSKVVVVFNGNKGFAVGTVFPTVTKNNISVDVFAAGPIKVSFTISNMNGQAMITKTASINQSYKQVINLENLAAGMYMLQIAAADGTQKTIKVIKQ